MAAADDNIIRINPSAPFYFERAFDAYHQSDLDKGIKYFKRGISLADNPYEEHYGAIQLALIYQHQGEFQKSYDLVQDLLDKSGKLQADLYYYQAVNCSYLKDYREAKQHLETFINLLDQRPGQDSPYRSEAEDMLVYLANLD